MVLCFSEPFVRGSQQVTIRGANGHPAELPPSRGAGAVVHQALPPNLRGVFLVSWRVLSDDGHVSAGEYAFAVGSLAALPTVTSSSPATPWSQVTASWLVFVGLALAIGGLFSERFVWGRTSMPRTVLPAPVGFGVALAVAGALLELVLLAGNQRGGGLLAGLHFGAVANAVGSRPGKLTLAIVIALIVSGVFVSLGRLRLGAFVPLFAAVALVAARGHSGTSGRAWAPVADTIHLGAVAIWLGALAHLVLLFVRRKVPRQALVDGGRQYSRLALPTVLVILLTGVLTAIPEFRSVGAVVSSGYGRTLLVKAGLIAVGLMLALAARQRALPSNREPRLALLRRFTLFEGTALAAALAVAAVLANAAPPRTAAANSLALAALGPPAVAGP